MNIGKLVGCVCAAGVFLGPDRSNAETSWFGDRLFDQCATDLRKPAYGSAPAGSSNACQIPPQPFDSPPFPSGDWQIGGTPIIGEPGNVAAWPLTEAIYARPTGDWWKKTRIQIYGWEDFSFKLSTSNNTSHSSNANFPLIYDLRPNRIEQNQFVPYIERVQPDRLRYQIFRTFVRYNLVA